MESTSEQYDSGFFDDNELIAEQSAMAVISQLRKYFQIDSVLDLGCARGGWLAIWKQTGVSRVVGVDGNYVEKDRLLIEITEFMDHDLSQPFRMERRFDLSESLEVAEHLPAGCAEAFVESLVHHSELVLFSAAPPGQGGMQHVNEQPYEYWRHLFAAHDYIPLDLIRPQICNLKHVAPWYRYNCLVYVHHDLYLSRINDLQPFCIEPGPIPDISPLSYRVRKSLVRKLPITLVDALARQKQKIEMWKSRWSFSRDRDGDARSPIT